MAHSATPRPSTGHVVWTTFGLILYLAAALYLLLRAEGFTLNFREAVVLETGVVTADFTHPVEATLDTMSGSGKLLEFRDLPPGRHQLTVTANGRVDTAVFVDAVPRRVTRIPRTTLPPAPPTLLPVHRNARTAAISPDQRFAGILRSDAHAVDVLRIASDTFESVAAIPLPPDVEGVSIWWPLQEELVVLAKDRALLVRLPDRVREVPLRSRPISVLAVPGTAALLLRMENRDILSLAVDGSSPQRVLDTVDAVGTQRSTAPLFVRDRTMTRADGGTIGPALSRGVVAVGVQELVAGYLVWDRSGQGWLLEDGAWNPLPFPVGGTADGDSPLLIGAGALRGVDGSTLLQRASPINEAVQIGDDAVLLRSAESLIQCSLALRQCSTLAENVAAFWPLGRGVVVQQRDTLSLIELEA